jgi:hypothetical protein
MSRRMTVVFHDDDLYTNLKIAAVRRNRPASDIVAEAIWEWLESREDAELLTTIEAARTEWRKKGGRPWSKAEKDLEEAISTRERAESKRVPD